MLVSISLEKFAENFERSKKLVSGPSLSRENGSILVIPRLNPIINRVCLFWSQIDSTRTKQLIYKTASQVRGPVQVSGPAYGSGATLLILK